MSPASSASLAQSRSVNPAEAIARFLNLKTMQLEAFHAPYQIASELVDFMHALHGAGAEPICAETREAYLSHPLAKHFLACPLTAHSRSKPRGYDGDAGLLDHIYQHATLSEEVLGLDETVRGIYEHNVGSPAGCAVRGRRALLAQTIQRVAAAGGSVLSVAAGHCRELELVSPAVLRQLDKFVALDQDTESLREIGNVAAQRGLSNVITVPAGIIELIRGNFLGNFDFVYSAGLFDYLEDRVAVRLTVALFKHLKPGGWLMIGNFLRGIRDQAYMDVFMDWRLILRDRKTIIAFADRIPTPDITQCHYFADPCKNIGYVLVKKG